MQYNKTVKWIIEIAALNGAQIIQLTSLIKNVVVAYADDEAIGCGAIKMYNEQTMEVKRMYVKENHRNTLIP